ncbi:MAG: NAD(P)H-dependent oxidoreductase subunit E [Chloroflexota bacterium]
MVKPYQYHVFVCTDDGTEERCLAKGAAAVRERFWTELGARGMEHVKVTRMGCTVQHRHGPIVVVYPEGVWYGHVTVDDVAEIVEQHLGHGHVVERLVHYRFQPDDPPTCYQPGGGTP